MRHQGEHAVRRRAGLDDDPRGSDVVGATVPEIAAAFLARQRMIVIGAADRDGAVWASLLTGPPGFATVPDDRSIAIHARPAPADPLSTAFETERDIGLLAIEPATRHRIRANGKARRDGNRLVVHTEQVYANCPKYIQSRTPDEDGVYGPRAAVTTGGLTADQRRWIATADTFFIASHADGLGSDVSHRGGNPGFVTVTVTGSRRLTWPDYVGNSMYMTLGNLDIDPRCGLLFLDWERGHLLHLTGRARVDWNPERAAAVPGARRVVDLDVDRVVQIDHASPQRWSFGGYFRHNPA